MRIIDRSRPLEGHSAVAGWMVKPECEAEPFRYHLQSEHAVQVYVNDALAMNITCSPRDIVELVLGRLFTQNIIADADEVDELELCEDSSCAKVRLHKGYPSIPGAPENDAPIEDVGTCYSESRTVGALFQRDAELRPLSPIPWSAQDVFALARVFEGDTPMHRRTYGAHSCYLARGNEILYCCEDLGRHNAFDKVIGSALRDGVDLGECTVFTSGRVPTDMALKAVRAHIPIMVSKAVPTDLAARMAAEYRLTLICSAHSDSFVVVNDPLAG